MADAVAPFLHQLLSHINDFVAHNPSSEEALDCKRMIAGSFDDLMKHLRTMMLGYENEEVYGLLKIIEAMASRNAWYDSREAMMDVMAEIIEELCNIRYISNAEGKEIAVGFDEEVEKLLEELTETKKLQVISIVGTPGLGKTTLADKLYNHPLIDYKFGKYRAWTSVSQDYVKRHVLLKLLESFINVHTHEISKLSDGQLGEKLHRFLKGHKYLVVLDDVWDSKVWHNLQIYFPDDNTGSRVVFTSRNKDVSLHVGAAREPHVLRLRTAEESWEIFQKKVFWTGICPHRLRIIGKEISNKCEGLPLAVVITAGLFKNKWFDISWRQIADDLHSLMVGDPSKYMSLLALSYNQLPPYLKQCFLFLGVFPEDYDIPVTKLIWLWVAQGFIEQTGSRILEDVAQDFLMELIQKSLLMTSRVRADDQIKSCRIHDLLRDFCLRKAEEEQNSPQIYRYVRAPVSSLTTHIQSGLCYPFEMGEVLQAGGSVFSEAYKSLSILDVESVPVPKFPSDVTQLVFLRYLAIQANDGSPPLSISDLVNLQILIILSIKNIVVPKTIWNMVNLRHLYIKSGENRIEEPYLSEEIEKDGCSSKLASLQTLSQVCPQSCQNISSRTPNLRTLGFCGPLISTQGDLEFPNIVTLNHLQKLKLLNTVHCPKLTRLCDHTMFPKTLEKLTLSNTGMAWENIWTFACLPNLKVLKLRARACIGEKWGTSDAIFEGLKVLKLHDLDLKQWDGWSSNFPVLRCLVVRRCLELDGIPSDLGYISTLEVMEVIGCSKSAHDSAIDIQGEQKDDGNDFLKVRTDQQDMS